MQVVKTFLVITSLLLIAVVSIIQAQTIEQQRATIKEMVRNPECTMPTPAEVQSMRSHSQRVVTEN